MAHFHRQAGCQSSEYPWNTSCLHLYTLQGLRRRAMPVITARFPRCLDNFYRSDGPFASAVHMPKNERQTSIRPGSIPNPPIPRHTRPSSPLDRYIPASRTSNPQTITHHSQRKNFITDRHPLGQPKRNAPKRRGSMLEAAGWKLSAESCKLVPPKNPLRFAATPALIFFSSPPRIIANIPFAQNYPPSAHNQRTSILSPALASGERARRADADP